MRPKQYPYSGNKKESIAVTVDSEKLSNTLTTEQKIRRLSGQ
ncbi:Uncharacterised protein [Streptococcus agalactiae]|nr:Uncharacterised protein [Streptococcus agalactiae]